MKLAYFSRFPLLTRLMTLQLSLSGAQATTGLPAAEYTPHGGELTPRGMTITRNAWQYFVANFQPTIGLINVVNKYPSTTVWDSASYLAAMTAARELGVIDRAEFGRRMLKFLATLNKLDLFRNKLPNKVCNTVSGQKVNYRSRPSEVGYSALDIGRILVWLKVIKERYPGYSNSIDNVALGWDLSHVVDPCGTLYGTYLESDQPKYVQEGCPDYEEYGVAGFQLWGSSTHQAGRSQSYELAGIYCMIVPYDSHDPRQASQHNYVISESYVLYSMEFGFDNPADRNDSPREYSHLWMENLADRVYQAQENHYTITGILTTHSEHQLSKSPYLIYDIVLSDGFSWSTITDKGQFVSSNAAVSPKVAMGIWVLQDSPYADRLLDAIENANEAGKDYHGGLYENGDRSINGFTANNNDIMLEALLFKKEDKLLRSSSGNSKSRDFVPSLWGRKLMDLFEPDNGPHSCPFLNNTPAVKMWREQAEATQHTQPAYRACQCTAYKADEPVKLPPMTAQCLKP